jgi:hypothetical protein
MLQQDHGWIEENWLELAPNCAPWPTATAGPTRPSSSTMPVFLSLCEAIALEESLIYPESKARWARAVARRLTELPPWRGSDRRRHRPGRTGALARHSRG